MKTILRLLCMWFAFTAEVQVVQAAGASAKGQTSIMEEPVGCLVEHGVCAILNQGRPGVEFISGDNRFYMGKSAAVVRLTKNDLRVVKGEFLVSVATPLMLRSEFGQFSIDENSKLLVYKTKSEMRVAIITGSALVKPLGESGDFRLASGYEVAVTGVDRDGIANLELARPINLSKLLRSWGQIGPESFEELKVELLAFKPQWESAVVSASSWHKGLIERRVAQIEDRRAKQRQARAQWEAESRRLLKLYRKKMLIDGF